MTDAPPSNQINPPTATISRQTLLSTAQTAIQSYNTLTPTSILSYRSPICLHYILPSSLQRPPLTNDQYAAYFIPVISAFKHFHVTVDDTIVDEAARKVVMHASSTGSTVLGPYSREYMLVLHMTEDGRQVDRFYEFVDSAASLDLMPRLRGAMAAEPAQGTKE